MPHGVRHVNKELNREIAAEQQRIEACALVGFGHITGWLEAFAHQEGISTVVLTTRIQELLQGARPGSPDSVSSVPGEASAVVGRVSEVEVDGRTRGKASRKSAIRGKSARKGMKSRKYPRTASFRRKMSRMMKARWAQRRRERKALLAKAA